MSLRVGCSAGSMGDEVRKAAMPDSPSWIATGAVLRAGRELSSWVFGKNPASYPSRTTGSAMATNTSMIETSTPYHINSLPQEMLEEIFRQYLRGLRVPGCPSDNEPTGSLCHIVSRARTSTTPFTLAHTCSFWRTIIMSNPSFWSTIVVCEPRPCDFPLFEFWLSRSGDCPLDLTIAQWEILDEVTDRILYLAMSHSSRWKSISLRLEADMEALLTRKLPRVPIPQLERFQLDLNLVEWSAEGVAQISHHLSSSPRIRGATLQLRACDPALIAATNWACLSDVRIHHIQLVDLLHILPSMVRLRSLSILSLHDPAPGHSIDTTQPPTLLPGLTSLSLESHNNLSALWNSLTAPSLRTLCIGSGFGNQLTAATRSTPLSQFVKRSACQVLALDWTSESYSPATLTSIMADMSTSLFHRLQQIRIGSSVDNDFLAAFASEGLFPHLREMELCNCVADRHLLQTLLLSRPRLHVHGRFDDLQAFSVDSKGCNW
ncbi:hypothetical protein NMY22_g4299 [Coprinellus aureogranulatus]|nr:hypothetical protein NMY22_g4299 [Coprinellus aureogranulatus]